MAQRPDGEERVTTSAPAVKKKTPVELELDEGQIRSTHYQEGVRPMIIAPLADSRSKHLRGRRMFWWTAAVLVALAVVLAGNALLTDAAVWLTFAVVARLEVVDRRRVRRAAHRAALRDRMAMREAIVVGNAHVITEVAA